MAVYEAVETVDPADYLMNNTIYHDCKIKFGDPEMDEIEIIGVCSAHLVSHSTVFRNLMMDGYLADQSCSNIHITDVSPAVFKLMLRYLYGGELPVMSRETTVQLLLCADKYNIRPLVNKTGELLVPNNTNELFPALECVAKVCVPKLQDHVCLFLNEHFPQVLMSEKYLLLDVNSLVFIAKQESLSITEIELWRSLLRWAKAKSEDPSQQRLLLAKLLQHVRFLTFTPDEITKEVASSKILSPEELDDMVSAVGSDDHVLASSSFCRLKNKRVSYQWKRINERFCHSYVISSSSLPCKYPVEYTRSSSFRIRTGTEVIYLRSFQIKSSAKKSRNSSITYICNCSITFHEIVNGYVVNRTNLAKFTQKVISNTLVTLPVYLSMKNMSVILQQDKCYHFVVTFDEDHPAFESDSYCIKGGGECSITYDDSSYTHVTSIFYNTQ